MKRLFFFFSFLVIQIHCLAQEIIWAKQFKVGGRSTDVSSFFQRKDSSFVAVGESRHFGYRIPNGDGHQGLALMYLNKAGDTTKIKNLNTYARSPKICQAVFFSQIFVATQVTWDTLFQSKIRLFKLDSLGNTIWARYLIGPQYERAQVTKLIATPDGGCIVLGHVAGFQFWSDWLVMKYSYNGDLEWSQRFNGGGTSEAHNIEPMPGGNYLVSGMVGNRIWSLVIDGEGQQLSNTAYFFHNSPNNNIFLGAWVTQSPQKKFYSGAVQFVGFNSQKSYVGRFDSLKSKIWGSYIPGSGLSPWSSLDGGFSRLESVLLDSNYLRRYHADSTLMWSVTVGENGKVQFNDMLYDGFNNAYLAGYKNDSLNRENAYIVKVANMGLPFDPTKNKAIYEAPPFRDLVVFPNPVRDRLHFKNVFFPSTILVFDMLGRKKGEFQIKPGEAIDLSHLPKGQYMVRVEAEGKARIVRVVKE